MKRYILKEAAHDPGDLAGLVAQTAMGDRITAALQDPANPLTMMMERAREAFIDAQNDLLNADLSNEDGIKQARLAQADARRYMDLVRWIDEARSEATAAFNLLDQTVSEEDPEVEALMDKHYGNRRAKPAPDA